MLNALSIPKGHIIRLRKSPLTKHISGVLASFKLIREPCCLIVLVGNTEPLEDKNNRISVIFADESTSKNNIESEMERLGDNCCGVVVHNTQEGKTLFDGIWGSDQTQFKIFSIDETVESVLIHVDVCSQKLNKAKSLRDISGISLYTDKIEDLNIYSHPDARELITAHHINLSIVGVSAHRIRVIYDDCTWCLLDYYNLHLFQEAKILIDSLGEQTDNIFLILAFLAEHDALHNTTFASNTNLSLYIQARALKYNAHQMLVNNMKAIIRTYEIMDLDGVIAVAMGELKLSLKSNTMVQEIESLLDGCRTGLAMLMLITRNQQNMDRYMKLYAKLVFFIEEVLSYYHYFMGFQNQAMKASGLRERAVEQMNLATQQLEQKELPDAMKSLTIAFNSLKELCHQGDSLFILCLFRNVSVRIETHNTLLPTSQTCLYNALHGQSLRYRHDSDMQQVYSRLHDLLEEMIEKSLVENLETIKSSILLLQEIEELYQTCDPEKFLVENKKILAAIFSQIFLHMQDLPTLSSSSPDAFLADVNYCRRLTQSIEGHLVSDVFEENLAIIEELVELGNRYYCQWQPTHHPTYFIQFALFVIEKAMAFVDSCKRMIPNDSSEQFKEQSATLMIHASSLRSSFTFFNQIHFIHQEAESAIEHAKNAGVDQHPAVKRQLEAAATTRINENSFANFLQ